MKRLGAEFLVPGAASGKLVLLSAPLSFYGGFDVPTGTIADATHPERGAKLANLVMAMHEARGSSSSASALVEAARSGTAPAAIILGRLDPILVIGALVAYDLYRVAIPIVLLPAESWVFLKTGSMVALASETSQITITR